jgi:SSS family transporter
MWSTMLITSFLFCLLIFVIIGALSVLKSRHNHSDYLMASQSIPPWQAGLSAVATTNSGYMFVGMIGHTYSVGISSIWLMIGWITGDIIASSIIHKKLRIATEKQNSNSFGSILSTWQGTNYTILQALVGIITLVFLGTYAAAQLTAGGKALHVLFDWNYNTGAWIGAVIVLIYCYAGGLRASIWTDVAQSIVMVVAMALLLFISLQEVGGFSGFWHKIHAISPTYHKIFPQNLQFGTVMGPLLFVTSWIFAGFGIIGQPHVMIRFMALDDHKHIAKARLYYYLWYITFFCLTIGVGFSARLLLSVETFDAELALPLLAQNLLPSILVGLILAGLFSATISTADSQIISCSAALTMDLSKKLPNKYLFVKLSTFIVTALALFIALSGSKSVFKLVIISWAVLGSAFMPLMTLYALNKFVSQPVAIAMVLGGILITLAWRYTPYAETIYEIMPGIISGFIIYSIGRGIEKYYQSPVHK